MSASKTPRSKRPVSTRQLAANRANAARSTGPQTAEGKARSAQNSRRHGFAAADFAVVRLEDLQAVANLKADLVAVCRPVSSQELFALERIALAQQALLRAARLEAGLFTTSLNEAVDTSGNPLIPMSEAIVGDLEVTRAQNRNFALAEGFRRLVREGNTWTLFLRYQAQAERLYRRAVEEFERLKAQRGDLPNEPNFESQPEESTTPSAPPETNPIEPGNAVPAGAETSVPASRNGRKNPDGFGAPDACRIAGVRLGPLQPAPLANEKPRVSERVKKSGHTPGRLHEINRLNNCAGVSPGFFHTCSFRGTAAETASRDTGLLLAKGAHSSAYGTGGGVHPRRRMLSLVALNGNMES